MSRPGSMSAALSACEARIVERRGDGIKSLFEQQIGSARSTLVRRQPIGEGDSAPDFSLPATTGAIVSLSEILKTRKVILTFYRGSWCAFCNAALPVWQRCLPDVEANGAVLLAISPETIDHARTIKNSAGLTYELLSDRQNQAAGDYGLEFPIPADAAASMKSAGIDVGERNGTGDWTVPATATSVVGQDRRILLADCGPDYRMRIEPRDVIAVL